MSMGLFEQKLLDLRAKLIEMGRDVLEMLKGAGEALTDFDRDKARAVMRADREVNDLENRVVNKAITLIATNQPVAGDLRFLASSLRLASELERIGDLGSNLARRTIKLIKMEKEGVPSAPLPGKLPLMVEKALHLLETALTAFETSDADLAREAIAYDDEIDELYKEIRNEALATVYSDGRRAKWGFEVCILTYHIERLGDHATNVAEETVYMAQGKTIRHNHYGPEGPASEGW
ncbi:MAG: phosphate signaling complex protein PhoU [Deltaproteobacteria bacterium]|jgi:phosphate transport system protein|nr:phosphate signaling complex protein PhoU [Deltaproteobacteria bacterium]